MEREERGDGFTAIEDRYAGYEVHDQSGVTRRLSLWSHRQKPAGDGRGHGPGLPFVVKHMVLRGGGPGWRMEERRARRGG
jgi:hypothetical protein